MENVKVMDHEDAKSIMVLLALLDITLIAYILEGVLKKMLKNHLKKGK